MRLRIILIFVLLSLTLGSGAFGAPAAWEIVKAGKARAFIAVPQDANETTRTAAWDIKSYVHKMSGTALEIKQLKAINQLKIPSGQTAIIVGFPDKKLTATEGIPDDTLLIRTSDTGTRKTITLSGTGKLGPMYAAYEFLEMLGVRFFHPEEEYIPKRSYVGVGKLDIMESPVYKWRGIQQHTLHNIPHTKIFMANPTEENLKRSYRYVDWLSKNRQNYLFWWWVERYSPKDRQVYVKKITDYAHKRGVNVGMVVGMPFKQQNSYNIMRVEACHSDTEKWTKGLQQGVDEMAAMGVDALCIFFGQNEGASFKEPEGCVTTVSGVQATVERIEALRGYVKQKYPYMQITLWVHPTAGIKGDDTCPNFFLLPKLCSSDVGAAIHTVQFYNLLESAPTYMNKDFSELREFALEQAKVRPVWYWPETAYACGFDCDVPEYWPGYIQSRWVDASFLSGKAVAHITFSTGLEWMYWLNDYAVAKFGWDPSINNVNTVVDDLASIFGPNLKGTVQKALHDLIIANDTYFIKKTNQSGFNLMNLFFNYTLPREMDALGGKTPEEIKVWRETYLAALTEFTDKHEKAYKQLKEIESKVGPNEKPWFDELLDSVEITYLRCHHMHTAFDLLTQLVANEHNGVDNSKVDTSELARTCEQARQIIEERQKHYRYPTSGPEGNYNGYMLPFAEWERVSNRVNQYISLANVYKDLDKWVKASPWRLNVFAPVGKTYNVTIDIPQDFPVDRQLSLFMQVDDIDSPKEGVVIIAGKEIPLQETGDSTAKTVEIPCPPGTFKTGPNEITFRFNDDMNGGTGGYYVSAICVGVKKTGTRD